MSGTADATTATVDTALVRTDGAGAAMVTRDVASLRLRFSADDYAAALASLLPTGRAWPRDRSSTVIRLTAGLASPWAKVNGRVADLLEREGDPRLALDLLSEWERAFGLPDGFGLDGNKPAPGRFRLAQSDVGAERLLTIDRTISDRAGGFTNPQTLGERRAALLAKLTLVGNQSREFFIGVAAALGYAITITEFSPFMVGVSRLGDTRPTQGKLKWFRCGTSRCGVDPHLKLPADFAIVGNYPQRIGSPTNRFVWRVNFGSPRASRFHVGSSRVGVDRLLQVSPKPDRFRVGRSRVGVDPLLRLARASELEAVFRRLKPAHSHVIFNYGQV